MAARARHRPQPSRARRALVALALVAAALTTLAPGAARAARDEAAICLAAADRAADRHGVPRAVMRALTRTETGRASGGALQPWPWTVNMEGAGHWFDDRAAALDYVRREQARGAVSFDVGCFQINFRWHGEHFDSVEQMFDPAVNSDYAARFMAELYAETRDWTRAAGYYHSRTPEFFNRYSARFARILERGDEQTGPVRVAALDAARPPAPERDPDRRPAGREGRAAPLLVSVEDAPPVTAGAISIRVLRGGLSPLGRATRPLIGP